MKSIGEPLYQRFDIIKNRVNIVLNVCCVFSNSSFKEDCMFKFRTNDGSDKTPDVQSIDVGEVGSRLKSRRPGGLHPSAHVAIDAVVEKLAGICSRELNQAEPVIFDADLGPIAKISWCPILGEMTVSYYLRADAA
jgi:hypothetical protein